MQTGVTYTKDGAAITVYRVSPEHEWERTPKAAVLAALPEPITAITLDNRCATPRARSVQIRHVDGCTCSRNAPGMAVVDEETPADA